MDVILVDLAQDHPLFKVPLWMPVYLPSIAGTLRKAGHGVVLLERGAIERRHSSRAPSLAERVAEPIRRIRPRIVLFDVRADTVADLPALVRAAREAAPGALILAGGRHPTLCPEATLEDTPELDGVIVGEAENAMQALAGGAAIETVPAAAFRRKDGLHLPAAGFPVQELDDLALPAWDLMDMSFYTRRTPRVIPCLPLRTATLETSRGCRGTCTFCSEGRMNARTHRFHRAEYVIEALRQLIRNYGIDAVYFSDESFLANPERVLTLCDEFVRQGIHRRLRWSAQVRTDSVTAPLLAALREAGCVQLEYGVESGSSRVLDVLAKGVTVEQNEAAIRLSREAGIRSLAYIMYGVPGETQEDLRATEQLLERAQPDLVRFTRFIPYPGTPETLRLVAEGRLPEGFWKAGGRGGFRANLTAMPAADFRRGARRVYFRHVFPRFLADYRRHNRLADVFAHMDAAALASFLWHKVRGKRMVG